MQEGNIRFEASVSVRLKGETALGQRTEIKNLNSYSGVRKAIYYERARQIALLEAGKTPRQETRLWDGAEDTDYEAGVPGELQADRGAVQALLPVGKDPWSGRTQFMRSKEDAHDYRYFPEPDMPAFSVSPAQLDEWRADLPELPGERRERYAELGVLQKSAEVLARDAALAAFFERVIAGGVPAVDAANYTLNQISALLNTERLSADQSPVPPEHVAELHQLITGDNTLSKDLVLKQVWPQVIADGLSPRLVVEKYKIEGVDDSAVIAATDAAWAASPKTVSDLLAGKKKAAGAIVGAVMKALKGKASPQVINARIAQLLEEERG
jgi:aspartyl-tRNA(Asn)/glutamyl-tRNA(Gln) amidotransferase subunit B